MHLASNRPHPHPCILKPSPNVELGEDLLLQLVSDQVPSSDDLPDLEETVCLETLCRRESEVRERVVIGGGRDDGWAQARMGKRNRELRKNVKTGQPGPHRNVWSTSPGQTHVNSNLGPLSVLSDALPVVWRDSRRPDLSVGVDPGVEVGRGCELLSDVDLSGEGGEDFEVVYEGVLVR